MGSSVWLLHGKVFEKIVNFLLSLSAQTGAGGKLTSLENAGMILYGNFQGGMQVAFSRFANVQFF